MKYLLLSLLVVIGIVSCQKEITDEVPGGVDTTIVVTPTGKMEADIDSVHWVANESVYAVFSPADSFNKASLIISGTGTDSNELTMIVADSGKHVYSIISSDSADNTVVFGDTASSAHGDYFSTLGPPFSKVGSVAVTSIDTAKKTISGTFTFKVYRSDSATKTFTNGTFTDVPYVTIGDTGLTSTDTFRVKYSDTAFSARPGEVAVASSGISLGIGAKDSSGRRNFDVTFPLTIVPGTYSFDSTAGRWADRVG